MALPYIDAAKNDAIFNLPPDNSILSQCPNPEAAIDIKIFCREDKKIALQYVQKKSPCPLYDFKPGVQWELDGTNIPFCPRAYDSLFPYLWAASTRRKAGESYKEGFTATCPAYPGYIVFKEVVEG